MSDDDTPDPLDAGRFVDAALARIHLRSVNLWLHRWKGAGFVPRLDGRKIIMPQAWADQFPDGPHLIDIMRATFVAVIRDGFHAAADADPRLRVPAEQAYCRYAAGVADDTANRLRHAERNAAAPRDDAERAHLHQTIGTLKAQLADLRVKAAAAEKRASEAERRLAAARPKAVPA